MYQTVFGFVTNTQGTQFLIHLRVGCHILQTRNNFVTKMPHCVHSFSCQFGYYCRCHHHDGDTETWLQCDSLLHCWHWRLPLPTREQPHSHHCRPHCHHQKQQQQYHNHCTLVTVLCYLCNLPLLYGCFLQNLSDHGFAPLPR